MHDLTSKILQEYESLNEVYCPYFKENVKFTRDGFMHLLFKGSKRRRPREDNVRSLRLKLFPLAPKILKITHTVQEFHKQDIFLLTKIHKEKIKVLKPIKYWGFIAIVERHKVKVVVKQVGNGYKKFWSIIPNWVTRKSGDEYLRIMHSGDMETI